MRRTPPAIAHLLGLLIGLVVVGTARPAAAKSDNRLEDRFFFALYGGVSMGSADSISLTNSAKSISATKQSGVGSLFGIETSFWPCDYAAVGLSGEVFSIPPPSGQDSATTADLGLLLVIALPLRYVQPYGGVWGGLRVTWLGGQSSGVLLAAHPLAGLNFYVTRNIRLFAQWQYVPLDYAVVGTDTTISYAGASTHLLGTGVRFSPDFFHSARAAMKADIVWWSGLLAVAAWGIGNWIGSSR